MDNSTGALFGAIITLMIFSYLLTDKVLFRWALALLVGCGVGYTLALTVRFVIFDLGDQLASAESFVEKIVFIIPLLLGVILLLKGLIASKRLGWLAIFGNISVGYLVGVGTAVAISGALLGTLIPQIAASGSTMSMKGGQADPLQGIFILIGTITSLLVFSPVQQKKDGQPHPITRTVRGVGRFFIVVALAVAFSGALTSALTALVVRWWHIVELLLSFIVRG